MEQDHHNWPTNTFILKLLEFILTRNYFLFMDQMYLQIQGVASCAPSYANLYLGGWERMVFSDDLMEPFLDHVLGWFRFIDDLLVIWTGTEQLLQTFIAELNINSFNLHFTFSYDRLSIPFLDVLITKDSTGHLTTDLYRKPTAGNTLLHASSLHPRPLVRSIPFAQYLRLRRNCTEDGDFYKQANALRTRLLARGYKRTVLRKAFPFMWGKQLESYGRDWGITYTPLRMASLPP